ncbi:rRNA maturation RNase YbeY [Komagataeibacter sp. FNDCF1]|uniref:rRNA maturation RNase YbeY n=1 Tax=Komagataeibacter sp. FNDCF1 TaxID=2878681 RepID=UPI001E2AB4BD|nr:rRNA maturation RNase YbeY [Komagataeibacter sp. FNDCF1]MCE2563961.1 rRNA maturation RNase YbeY [Komagataeibacter sp. FNDCF1]
MPGPTAIPVGPDITVADRRWHRAVPHPARLVTRAVNAALDATGERGPVTVVLADDRTVMHMNWRHRGRNRPTNVLTFEYAPAHATGGLWGGDIIIAFETVAREARAAGRSMAAHLAHLVVHGVLHLARYDHHHPGEAREMEMEEGRILSTLGFANPWKPGRMATARGARS